jgi:hypothetical protein
MKRFVGVTALLALVGLVTVPSWAAEFRVTGFFDNVFPHVDSNVSSFLAGGDLDMTRKDHNTFGRERARFFFNFIASDDLRGVFALELDNVYGAPRVSLSGRCLPGSGLYANEQCGFRNGIDVNNLELKNLYVDFRIPQLPIANRVQIGGIPADVTPLHPLLLYTMDAGGGSVKLDLTDQVSLLLHYIQLEEDLDRFRGSVKLGEDYLAGATLMLRPLPALDLHLLGIFGHLQAPFGPNLAGFFGPFGTQSPQNVTTEDRYYVGFDARYRIGNLTIDPTFIYLLGTRKFCTPGSLTQTFGGALTPCTSPSMGARDIAFNAFETQLVLQYSLGSWLWAGKFAYASGQSANDDINNTGIGRRSDVKGFLTLSVDNAHVFGEWFEILGKSDVDGVGMTPPYLAGEIGNFSSFGWTLFGAKTEYQATNTLVLEGAVGAFWTVAKTACPAVFRVGSLSGPCAAPGSPLNAVGQPIFNLTGNSRYAGTEIDAGLRYTILPGLTWTPRFGWAFLGDAFAINNRRVLDAWAFANRMIYVF